MNRPSTPLVATVVILLATTVAWGALGGAVGGTAATSATATNHTELQPGTVVSGVIGVQGAQVDQAVVVADLEVRLENAETPAARARVVADTLDRVARRTDTLERRLDGLRSAEANDSIGTDTYAVRVAPVAADARRLGVVLDRIGTAAATLDSSTLREAGVTRDRIDEVQSRVDRLVAADEGALSIDGADSAFYSRIATLADTYNERARQYDLGVLGSHLGGERINLHITESDGDTTVISFRTTSDTRVRELRAGPHPDATLRASVDEATARRILNAENPGELAVRAFVDGDIRIDGLGLYNAIKWTVANAMLGIARAIVGIFTWLVSLVS